MPMSAMENGNGKRSRDAGDHQPVVDEEEDE